MRSILVMRSILSTLSTSSFTWSNGQRLISKRS